MNESLQNSSIEIIASELENSLREKGLLLKEVHHRVKNNMQVLSSLMRLQARYLQDPKAQQMFQENDTRIRSMALVHEKLYQSKDLSRIDFAQYARELTAMLCASYTAQQVQVNGEVCAAPLFLHVDTAIPLGLALHELLSMCLKRAATQGRSGAMNVQLHVGADDMLTITVCSDVHGVNDDGESPADAFGLQLVKILAKQLSGKFACIDREGEPQYVLRMTLKNVAADNERSAQLHTRAI